MPAHRTLPQLCASARNHASDLFWETIFGTQTAGYKETNHPDGTRHESLAYKTYFRALKNLSLGRTDVLVDLGCGKGRVLCAAGTQRLKEVIGVEVNPELFRIAEMNAARMRFRVSPIRVICQPAEQFQFRDVTVLVMFNPFGAETMRQVMSALHDSLNDQPRRIRIAYCNPLHDSVLGAQPWLECYDRWQPSSWSTLKVPVSFWRLRS